LVLRPQPKPSSWRTEQRQTATDALLGSQDRTLLYHLRSARSRLEPANSACDQVYDAGISESTLDRAKKSLAVRSCKTGMDGGWTRTLPEAPDLPRDEGLRSRGPEFTVENDKDFKSLVGPVEGDQETQWDQTMIPFADEADDA
jgi:hypothetical protein